MLEHKIVQYKAKTIYFDEEHVDRRGKKTVKHMERTETDEEFFARIASELNGFSAEGWTVAAMNNVMPSNWVGYQGGNINYSEYFTFLLTREKEASVKLSSES